MLLIRRSGKSHSATASPRGLMEPAEEEPRGLDAGSSNRLALPEPCPWGSDDELLGIGGIEPKSSPIPRRRSSSSCSDDDSQPPPSGSRRVSFADAFGLSLVSVKQFDQRSLCDHTHPIEAELNNATGHFLELLFALPVSLEELLYRVQEQKVDLESLELLPGTTTLKGTVRVLNMCFDKLVYIRTSLDCWSSHFDLLAEYLPELSRGITDGFSFRLTLVPPFGQQGARVDFCIRYETPFGTFWANNRGRNYVLFCHGRAKEPDANEKLVPKSCLKSRRHSSITSTSSNAEEIPEITLNGGTAAVTEPLGVKEVETPAEHRRLKQEESIRNSSRRSRRKAARTAKPQRYFAQRDEKDLQQTQNHTDDVTGPVPAIDEAPSNPSTPQTDIVSLPAEARNTDEHESAVASVDVERNQISASQTQKQEKDKVPVIHSDSIAAKSQTCEPASDSVNSHKSGMHSQLLEDSQDKDPVTSQAVGPKDQTADKSIGKTVEKAWESFEKCAMEKLGSTTDANCSRDEADHVENTPVDGDQASQTSAHQYTFETIVAPLYHQVFKRVENGGWRVKSRTPKAHESAGIVNDGRIVTYTREDPGSNPEISAQPGNDRDRHGGCRETFGEHFHPTGENVPEGKTERVGEDFQNVAIADTAEYLSDADVPESDKEKIQMTVSLEESMTDQAEETPEMILLQSEPWDDAEYLPNLKPPDGVGELDITAAKSEDTPTSLETQISNDGQRTLSKEAQTSEQTKCLDGSYTSMLDSKITAEINQTEDLAPFQDPNQATIQPLIPSSVTTVPHFQPTDDPSLNQETSNTRVSGESSQHVGSEMESNPSEDVDDNETVQAEMLSTIPDQRAVGVSRVDPNREHMRDTAEVTGLHELLVQDTAMSDNGSNLESGSQEDAEENSQVNEVEMQIASGTLEVGSVNIAEGSYLIGVEEEEVKIDVEEQITEPGRDEVDWTDEQVTVGVLQQEEQNTGLEETSGEPESKRNSAEKGEEPEDLCGTASSQQTLDVNLGAAFGDEATEEESKSEAVDQRWRESEKVDDDDSASTESLTDDEMELCLLRLKNTQRTGPKDAISTEKRHSISRSWTISPPMPPISENTDEDQPSDSLDDLIPERDAGSLLDEGKEVIDLNLLWWRGFFSSENMTNIMVYTLLVVVFLITAYICDFVACFGLYLIALYWLYFQVQREPLKGT